MRSYDPWTGRFNQVDGANQFASGYTGMANNPVSFIDPDGQFAFLVPMLVGAAISALSYTGSVAMSNGGFSNWSWGQFGKSVGIGALSGAVSFGVGSVFGPVASSTQSFNIGRELGRASLHGFSNGVISELSGGKFLQGAAAGMFGSVSGSAMHFIDSPLLQIGASAVSGGIGTELSGGNFWHGAAIGGIVAGTNHLMHPDPLAQFKREIRGLYKELKEIGAFPKDFAGGFKDFYDTYMEMRAANLIDSDKYFHSKANYKATLRGKGGEYAAEKLSNMREFFDQRWPKFDSKAASLADQKANVYGRSSGRYYRNLGMTPSYNVAIPLYRKSYFGNH